MANNFYSKIMGMVKAIPAQRIIKGGTETSPAYHVGLGVKGTPTVVEGDKVTTGGVDGTGANAGGMGHMIPDGAESGHENLK